MSSDPLATLRRIATTRTVPRPGERCDMCAVPVPDEHSHVVDLHSRSLLCACRPCYLLFTAPDAELRYRAVPSRYLSFPDARFSPAAWDALEIPVGLAFVFRNSVLERDITFYPGPAGATESELALTAWADVLAAEPRLRTVQPDVEALLLRGPGSSPGALGTASGAAAGGPEVHLVPIDVCYELVGRLRLLWRGFDGGQQARAAVEDFLAAVRARSRAVPPDAPLHGAPDAPQRPAPAAPRTGEPAP